MSVFGVRRSPVGFAAPWRLKMLDSQPGKSNMGPVSDDVHDFRLFQGSCHGFLTRHLSCFRPGCFQTHIYQDFGRNQKDARRKVMQNRGSITSRHAFFAHFVTIEVFDFSFIFEPPFPFPVLSLPKKCTLNISVNRSIAAVSKDDFCNATRSALNFVKNMHEAPRIVERC